MNSSEIYPWKYIWKLNATKIVIFEWVKYAFTMSSDIILPPSSKIWNDTAYVQNKPPLLKTSSG